MGYLISEKVRRKLTAILIADVKRYSRLMGEDERGTVRTLNACKELMTGLIQPKDSLPAIRTVSISALNKNRDTSHSLESTRTGLFITILRK